MPAINPIGSSGGSASRYNPNYQSGNFIPLSRGFVHSASGTATMSGRLRFTPFVLDQDLSLSGLSCRLFVAGSSTAAKFCIYNADPTTKRATTLVRGTADIDCTATGIKSPSFSGGNAVLSKDTLYLMGIFGNDNSIAWSSLSISSGEFARLKPPLTAADAFGSGASDIGQMLCYAATYASGFPDLTSFGTPTQEGYSAGSVMAPFMYGIVA